jgi:hypothetical protein
MGAATSMSIILIMDPALVEPLAEDDLAGFIQHQQLEVVLLDGDVELRLRGVVRAFPQGVVLGPRPLRLRTHWSMFYASCKGLGSCANRFRAKGSGNQNLDTCTAMMLHGILVATRAPPFLASARWSHNHAQYTPCGYICVKPCQ